VVSLGELPPQMEAGTTISVEATAENMGSRPLEQAEITLRVGESVLVTPRPTRSFQRWPAGNSLDVRWRICPTQPGYYVVLVEVGARAPDGISSRQRLRRGCCRSVAQTRPGVEAEVRDVAVQRPLTDVPMSSWPRGHRFARATVDEAGRRGR
jgi:hypothetical protein